MSILFLEATLVVVRVGYFEAFYIFVKYSYLKGSMIC
jgi:hypothetical protein